MFHISTFTKPIANNIRFSNFSDLFFISELNGGGSLNKDEFYLRNNYYDDLDQLEYSNLLEKISNNGKKIHQFLVSTEDCSHSVFYNNIDDMSGYSTISPLGTIRTPGFSLRS